MSLRLMNCRTGENDVIIPDEYPYWGNGVIIPDERPYWRNGVFSPYDILSVIHSFLRMKTQNIHFTDV